MTNAPETLVDSDDIDFSQNTNAPIPPPIPDIDGGGTTPEALPVRRIDILILMALPVAILVVLRASPYFRLNNGDPFIYAGYANDFRGHIERFGYTYHSVRFGLIFPLRASLIFGEVWGYFVLRYLLYLVAIIPLYFALRPLGRRAALLGPTLFIANPVTTLAVMSTHPDTIVVPLYVAMLSLMLIAFRHRGWPLVALGLTAGAIGGVAANANIFFAPIMAVSIALLAVAFAVEHRWIDALRVSLAFGFAVLMVSAAGMMVYRYMFNDANIYQTTLNNISYLQANNLWRAPSNIWLTTRRYVYAPPLAVLVGVVGVVRARHQLRREFVERALIVALLVLPLLYYAFGQFVQHSNVVETSYYYSYLIGPTCLVLAAAFGWSTIKRTIPLALVILIPVVIAYVSQLFEVRRFAYFAIVLAAAAFVIVRSRSIAAVAVAVVAVNIAWGSAPRNIAAIPHATFQYEPHYEIAFGGVDDTAFEAYELASQLPSAVPSIPGTTEPLLFWYRTGDALLDSVEASYHWETLAVQRSPAPGMPEIGPGDLDRLRQLQGGFVVLLGHEQGELDQGVAKLIASGFVVEPQVSTRLTADDSSVLVEPVRVVSVP
jgi:hypothetical protein